MTMKKIVAVIDYTQGTAQEVSSQLEDIFGDSLEIRTYSLEGAMKEEIVSSDIILIPSNDFYHEVKTCINSESEIVIMNRTLSRDGYEVIIDLPVEERVYVAGYSRNDARELCTMIYSLGYKNPEMVPLGLDELKGLDCHTEKSLISFVELPNNIKAVYEGAPLADLNTILDIGIGLDLDHVIAQKDLKNAYKGIVTAKTGIEDILKRVSRYDSQIKVFFDSLDEGIIEFDSKRKAVLCNEKAARILGADDALDGKLVGYSACDLIGSMSFNTVYLGRKAIEDEIVNIDDKTLVVSVYPVIQSGVLYGSMAIIREFHETEKKQHRIRNRFVGKGHRAKYTFDDIVGTSIEIRKCKGIAMRMAKSDSSVLIHGETGTGKELFAQAIHNESARGDYQFVAVNCGAFPESILESELFGYEDGAFTGARKGGKPGLFEIAHGGTLFLDEIGEMPKSLQVKLLRVLQEREIMRLASDAVISVDVRVIAASNRKLEDLVRENLFREDLYYRLNILPLDVPPLRERIDDILDIFNHFRNLYNGDFVLKKEAEVALLGHEWKGNIRELRNVVEYLVNLDESMISLEDLPGNMTGHGVGKGEKSGRDIHDERDDGGERPFGQREDMDGLTLVLRVLYDSWLKGERIGRRSIYQNGRDRNLYISEREIREILGELEEKSLVVIGKGRSGTYLTDEGAKYFEKLIKV